ncbi:MULTISPECIES: GntR family transcriptional regulator [Pseudarthrobacter]|uniref:DNA-binding GntR family transcriptional regulator n=1 Tax=Pseudarthrobacter niigatensis TaxID=369935 RepID=A0AAJ1SZX6_9MICC|nr:MULTISPECIES: GntR family transcriptional regulator [Pseudarthrobacter]MDQ0146912.1 DNA-binding GntR family transcriptional regulator [Pseudarthrobacter niigatensis]MDQ0267044.1 DNA-binding GntR family transcriptional regulator [Pseudarthrobacter niigatensis]QDG60971.1 GntR family transcriptional regulator [Pseudarthrobacter sp. NIBRBAC000502771]QDG87367.1 GntR family transcriptional regulator [Pseudarthrobacter sp. NIBRBAC000502770]
MATKSKATGGVSRQVLADHVYEALLVALMDGRLEAGTPVSIDGMARELDVSPTPVREALARLEATGMVRRMALRGYRVAPLFSPEELADLMDARLVIEPANAFMACKHADQELTGQLQQAIEDLKAAPRGPSFAEFRAYWEADERFHRLIAESAENQFLLSAYNALGGQVQRFRFFGGLGVTDADYAIAEHTEILKAFEAGDAELARQKMIDHIEGVKQRSQHDSEVRS